MLCALSRYCHFPELTNPSRDVDINNLRSDTEKWSDIVFLFYSFHKANYPLMKNCLEFYRQYKDKYECERGKTKHGALANILLCLEKAVEDGN